MRACAAVLAILLCSLTLAGGPPVLKQEPNTWVKRSPTKDGPISPGMGYETSLGYDPLARRVIRWGGHNQGGGGEQNAETWVYDPATGKWELKEPNTSPPGVCCAQQNVFDLSWNRFLRFRAFSGNHGWQWFREIYLNNSPVWSYDLATNTWRDMRPVPAPEVGPLRCASWDSDHQVVVIFAGEGVNEGTVVYDPYTNTWTRMKTSPQPAFRSGGNMTYDSHNKVHVLFGAQFIDDPHTWTYDLGKNQWRDMKPATMPPTDRNDAVLAYDNNSRQVIALVRVVDQKTDKGEASKGHLETWAYDVAKNTWTQLKPPREPDGWGNRRRVMIALPEQNVILTEHYVNPTEKVPGVEREQQIWTYRVAETQPVALKPPSDLRLACEKEAVLLSWKPSPSSAVVGYHVYRGTGTEPWKVTFERLAAVHKEKAAFRDLKVKPGTVYHYYVCAVNDQSQESAPCPRVRTQPRIVEDAVVSVLSAREVKLSWRPVLEAVGYHVERAPVEVLSEDEILRLKKDTPPLPEPSVGAVRLIGKFERLTKEPLAETAFTDTKVDLTRPVSVEQPAFYQRRFRPDQLDVNGKPYRYAVFAYRIRAVNRLGVESGPSPYYLTIPSAPQSVLAKEDSDKCHLKWAANPEKGLKGYRVYRMEGPRINGPGQKVTRLTETPVVATVFTDNGATRDTKRYWVVAVDALGQEGFPSAPVWHYRQYRKYYLPFIREWHQ